MEKKRPGRSRAKQPLYVNPVIVREPLLGDPEANAEPTTPRVAGWLYLFYLILVVAPLFHLRTVVLLYQQVAMFFDESSATWLVFAADALMRAGLSVLGLLVARGLVSGRPKVVQLAKRYLLATFVFVILSNVLPFVLPMPELARMSLLLTVWGPTLTCVFWVAVWSAYLRQSKRVRETYGGQEARAVSTAIASRGESRIWRGVATIVVFVWTLMTVLLLWNIHNENSLFRELKDSDRWRWESLGDDSNEAAEYALRARISPAELLATFEDETLFNAAGRVLEMDGYLTALGDRCQERDQQVIAKLILDAQRRDSAEIKPSDVAKALIAATEREPRRSVKCSDLIEDLPVVQPST